MAETNRVAGQDPITTDALRRMNALPETATVCLAKHYQIPEGWVIIGETVLLQDLGQWPNAWLIKRPEDTEIVCGISPIPSDYVKIEHVGSSACPGAWPNAWKIERLTSASDA